MKSHEVLEQVIEAVGTKQVASDLEVSSSAGSRNPPGASPRRQAGSFTCRLYPGPANHGGRTPAPRPSHRGLRASEEGLQSEAASDPITYSTLLGCNP